MASNTAGMQNIIVDKYIISVGAGSAVAFRRGMSSGGIPISDILIQNSILEQKVLGVSLCNATIGSYAYEDDIGAGEPTGYVAQDVVFNNNVIKGDFPANIKRFKNITFNLCRFTNSRTGSSYPACSINECHNVKLINCSFDSPSGYDLEIGASNTGTLQIIGCDAKNSRISVVAGGLSISAIGNIGISI